MALGVLFGSFIIGDEWNEPRVTNQGLSLSTWTQLLIPQLQILMKYDVYVNIPAGEEPTQHPERFAGRLDLFGVEAASRATTQHPGSGLAYTLDISGIYHALSTAPGWDPQHIDVALLPVRTWDAAPVTVGCVSLFFG
jgi:hypothetical protein